jgi:hypothetical protein
VPRRDNPPMPENDEMQESPPTRPNKRRRKTTQSKTNKQTGDPNYRRPPKPSGRFYDPPCSKCVKRLIDCEKDELGAACVRCYTLKNRCDYGQRHRLSSRTRRDISKRGRPKKKARVEVESEDELSGHRGRSPPPQKRAAKRTEMSDFIEESDDESMPSGYETSQPPPGSRSPTPPRRRPRAAAIKAKKAVAAAVAVDMANLRKVLRGIPFHIITSSF